MRQVVAIAGTALRRFFRDKSNYFFVFVFPMLLVVLIGITFSDAGSVGSVVVVGNGDLADELAVAFADVELDVNPATDVDEAETLVARGRADAAVVVDGDDETAFAGGEPTSVAIIGGSQAAGQSAVATVQAALSTVSDQVGAVAALGTAGVGPDDATAALDRVGEVGPEVVVTTIGDDDLGEEFAGLGQFDLGAAQQLSLFVFLASLSGATFLIDSRRLGVTRRELAAPMTTGQVIAGEALGRFVVALTQGVYIVIGTAVLFNVSWGNLWATTVVLAAFCAVSAAATMVFGAMLDNASLASGVGVGVGLVAAALGGSMLPLELFPDGLLTVSAVTPHHWAYEAYAEIQRRGGGVGDVLPQLGVLLAMTAVLLPLGAWLLRRSTERAI